MSTLINICRYHLVDRLNYLGLPLAILAFTLLVHVVIFTMFPTSPDERYTGGISALFIVFLVAGSMSMTKSLPFAFALGVTRHAYYLGTLLMIVGLAAAYGLGLTVLNAVEGATGGWGMSLHFFQIPWILDGPWYLTWLTSFVLLVLFYLYGMWFGLTYRRWRIVGLVTFAAAQVVVLLAASVAVTWADAWPAVGEFFATLTAVGLTGVLAALGAVMALGGFTTMRHVTV